MAHVCNADRAYCLTFTCFIFFICQMGTMMGGSEHRRVNMYKELCGQRSASISYYSPVTLSPHPVQDKENSGFSCSTKTTSSSTYLSLGISWLPACPASGPVAIPTGGRSVQSSDGAHTFHAAWKVLFLFYGKTDSYLESQPQLTHSFLCGASDLPRETTPCCSASSQVVRRSRAVTVRPQGRAPCAPSPFYFRHRMQGLSHGP